MKVLTVLQMVSGALAGIDSLLLAMNKTRFIGSASSNNGVLVTNTPPPSAHLEYSLLGCGIIMLICALFQLRAHIRFSGWQILLGIIITGGALFFSIRAATIGYGESSAIYYAMFGFLALGIVVAVIALLQLIKQD
jgi:hypothetical protein